MSTNLRSLLAVFSAAFLGGATIGCTTAPGLPCTQCGDACVDTATDSANCGACGTACGLGTVCRSSQCVDNAPLPVDAGTTCGAGQTLCGDTCASLASDPGHCGACGTACNDGEKCSAGQCAASCGAGLTDCNDACVALSTDPSNCGACGTVCAAQHSVANFCSGGVCVFTACQPGFRDCDGNPNNGCEAVETSCVPSATITGTLMATDHVTSFFDQHLVRVNLTGTPAALNYDGGVVDFPVSDGGDFRDATIFTPVSRSVLQVNGVTLPGSTGEVFYQTIDTANYYGVIMIFSDDVAAIAANDTLLDAGIEGQPLMLKVFDVSP